MDTIKITFDAWLRDHLARRGLSGGTLARRASLPANLVYEWIHGISYPDDTVLPRVAEVLGVTIGELQRARESSPRAGHPC